MKTILFLFSFMFVSSCVTANTESRDLSAVNTKPEHSLKEIKPQPKVSFLNWLFGNDNDKEILADCYSICEEGYHNLSDPCYQSASGRERRLNRCLGRCNRSYGKKESVKVASNRDQNPFNLLKESQNDKAPVMLALSFDCCVKTCIDDGGGSSECHRGCEE